MKILVIQLARLGDIFQTWPTLAALKRANPGAQIDLLTRTKFAKAAPRGLVNHHWELDTRGVLEPLIDERPGIDESVERLGAFCERICAVGYDRVINLSFSPFSSYLCREVAGPDCEVRGYTRHNDGYLAIPDDGSAYFYAQVGIDRPNRLHVTDLFAYIAGVELTEEDWRSCPQHSECARGDEFIAVHIGASVAGKTLSWSKWIQVVKGLLAGWPGNVVLIGSPEESEHASRISNVFGTRRPINLVGETSLEELREVIREARLLVGGDSGPVQIASLVDTPVLNLSLPIVSFWETGPKSKGSRILPFASEDLISSEEIVEESIALLNGKGSKRAMIRVPGRTVPYVETRPQPLSFEWELLRALYMSEAFPASVSDLFMVGLKRLRDVNSLAREQIQTIRSQNGNPVAAQILDRVDEIMEQIQGFVPELAPIVRWFRTERLRLGPMPLNKLIEATDEVHRRLSDIVDVYLGDGGQNEKMTGETGHDDIVLG